MYKTQTSALSVELLVRGVVMCHNVEIENEPSFAKFQDLS